MRCRWCRRIGDGPKPTEVHRRWWLDRFTLDEIREMAAAFWPEDGSSAPIPRRAKEERTAGSGVDSDVHELLHEAAAPDAAS